MPAKSLPKKQPRARRLTKAELDSYDYILVAFSGGKDSVACVLDLLDQGVDPSRIELWHHDVDGREGSTLMDWNVTRDYCRKFAEAFGMRIFFSWKVGGFEREMLRDNERTAPTKFECPTADGGVEVRQAGGTRGKPSTRRKWPMVTADLSRRWCSAYVKIDVCSTAINNQDRFKGARTLVVTGERAQESSSRSNYQMFEPHRCHRPGGRTNRHVDAYRPVHRWTEEEVWAIMERYSVNPHPAYRLGWGRVSCAACIFGNDDQWASLNAIDPERVEKCASYEDEFGSTIKVSKRKGKVVKHSLRLRVLNGTAYDMDERDVAAAKSHTFDEDIILPYHEWSLPKGAFKECGGPS